MEVIKTPLRQALFMLVLFGALQAHVRQPAAPHIKAISGTSTNVTNGEVKGQACDKVLKLQCISSTFWTAFLKDGKVTELNGVKWTARRTVRNNKTIAAANLDVTTSGIWRCQAAFNSQGTGRLSDPSVEYVKVTCKNCGATTDCTDPRLQCLTLNAVKTCNCRYGPVNFTSPFDGDTAKCRNCYNVKNVHPSPGCTDAKPICDITKNNGQGECIKSGNTNTGGSGSEIRRPTTWPVVMSAALITVFFRAFSG